MATKLLTEHKRQLSAPSDYICGADDDIDAPYEWRLNGKRIRGCVSVQNLLAYIDDLEQRVKKLESQPVFDYRNLQP